MRSTDKYAPFGACHMTKGEPFNPDCPSQDILALIGSKWSMLLLCILRDGPPARGELARRAGGISQKMLTQTLRELERHGIVSRQDFGTVPPRVEYSLTPLGIARRPGEADRKLGGIQLPAPGRAARSYDSNATP